MSENILKHTPIPDSKEDHDARYFRFQKEIEIAVNKCSMENYCNLPDFIISRIFDALFFKSMRNQSQKR